MQQSNKKKVRTMKKTSVANIIERYDAILIDAYGVLVDASGALPGAREFLQSLHAHNKTFYLLTNDASRLPESIAERFASLDLPLTTEHIITSGSLLEAYFKQHKLQHRPTIVLGNRHAVAYAERAGAQIVAPHAQADANIIVVADDTPLRDLTLLETMLSYIMRRLDANAPMELILCNPDLLYPQSGGNYGLTSGSVALVLEAALATRHAGNPHARFVGLGKPHAPIFQAAFERTRTKNMVLLGDQIGTDVQGAHNFGIDSVLLGTGVTRVYDSSIFEPSPTWFLPKVAGI